MTRPATLTRILTALFLALLAALGAHAQSSPPAQQSGKQSEMSMDMSGDSMRMEHGIDPARAFLMNESSGTGFQPSAWPMPMLMTSAGTWQIMWMAQAFVVDTRSEEHTSELQSLRHLVCR